MVGYMDVRLHGWQGVQDNWFFSVASIAYGCCYTNLLCSIDGWLFGCLVGWMDGCIVTRYGIVV